MSATCRWYHSDRVLVYHFSSYVFADVVNAKLLQWVGERLSEQTNLPVPTDLGPSWRDGIALCYLINSLCPGALPDVTALKPYHRIKNCRLALRLANQYLKLPLVGWFVLNYSSQFDESFFPHPSNEVFSVGFELSVLDPVAAWITGSHFAGKLTMWY